MVSSKFESWLITRNTVAGRKMAGKRANFRFSTLLGKFPTKLSATVVLISQLEKPLTKGGLRRAKSMLNRVNM